MDVDHCTQCGEPAHASETDDDGYHPECRPTCVYCHKPSIVLKPEARCEDCQAAFLRAAERERRIDAHEAHGDAMRDARKDPP